MVNCAPLATLINRDYWSPVFYEGAREYKVFRLRIQGVIRFNIETRKIV